MGEHAAALEAACTAISDLAAALAVVRPAALDGDGVQAKNQLEMAGIDLLSAQDATGEARREIDLAAPASGDVGVNVQGPARARGPALCGAPVEISLRMRCLLCLRIRTLHHRRQRNS